MAFGTATFNLAGGAVSDLFASGAYKDKAIADRMKARGQRLEAGEYDLAGQFAEQNKEFTAESTAIKLAQQDRQFYSVIGQQQAGVAAAGFAASGSALDLLAASAQQGALTRGVMARQGLIQEASYEEQAKSYGIMGQASRLSADISDLAAKADVKAAKTSMITGAIKGAAALATMFV